MTKEEEQLTPGMRVCFDVEGSNQKPYGYGFVTQKNAFGLVIKPDYGLANTMKMINIRRVA